MDKRNGPEWTKGQQGRVRIVHFMLFLKDPINLKSNVYKKQSIQVHTISIQAPSGPFIHSIFFQILSSKKHLFPLNLPAWSFIMRP